MKQKRKKGKGKRNRSKKEAKKNPGKKRSVLHRKILLLTSIGVIAAIILALFRSYIEASFFTQFALGISIILVVQLISFSIVKSYWSPLYSTLLVAILTLNTTEFTVQGKEKLLIYLISAVLFVFMRYVFRDNIDHPLLAETVASIISASSIPITLTWIISSEAIIGLFLGVFNLVLLASLIAFAVAVIVHVFLANIKNTAFMLRLESSLRELVKP